MEFLSHFVTTYTAEQRKRKNCDYDFKRKNNVCLSAYMSSCCSRFGKEFLSHPHSKRNEREQKKKRTRNSNTFLFLRLWLLFIHLYMYICLCTFFLPAEKLLLHTAYSYYCRLVIQTLKNVVTEEEGYIAWPLNVPSYLYNPFPSSIPRLSVPNTSSNENMWVKGIGKGDF